METEAKKAVHRDRSTVQSIIKESGSFDGVRFSLSKFVFDPSATSKFVK